MKHLSNTNVVVDDRPFVGRREELHSIAASFEGGAPLVTLLGGPGAGKTRLSLEHAAAQRDELRGAGGVWFCDLSLARGADELVSVVATRLGIPLLARGGDDAIAQVGRALAGRGPVLVVLDNLEQLVDHGAPGVVERWIDAAPQATFLVTSQRRVGLETEHVVEIAPLPRTVAIELFVTRARAARADFRLSDDNEGTISEIVEMLDGLPLGIELFAARVGVAGERELLRLLERRLDFTSLDPASPARHSTLRSAFDWSFGLLGDEQRSALAQCSVFRGSFAADAAQDVVAVEGVEPARIGPLLFSLVEASLLRRDASGRYILLESIRHYASEALKRTLDVSAVALRHERHYLASGARWASARDRKRLTREIGNLLAVYERALGRGDAEAALSAVLSLEPVFSTQGPFARYLQLMDRAFTSGEVPTDLRARALASRGLLATLQGRLDEAAIDYTRARSLAETAGNREIAMLSAVKLGLCAGLGGKKEESDRWFETAKREIGADASVDVRRIHFNDVGLVLTQQGKPVEASRALEQALLLHRESKHRRDEGVTLANLGGRCFERGLVAKARAYYEEALGILTEVDDRRSAGVVRAHMGQVLQELGDVDRARAELERAVAVEREVGDLAWEGIVLGMLGNLELEGWQPRSAARRYRASAAALAGSSYRRNAGLSLASLAVAEAACSRFELADEAEQRAKVLLADAGSETDLLAAELLHSIGAWLRSVKQKPDGRAAAEARIFEARARTEALEPPPDEVRFALRVIDRALLLPPRSPTPQPTAESFTVGPDARWFVLADGTQVDIARRGAMRRLLLHLVERRALAPGKGTPSTELFEAAWPGTRVNARSMGARVYVAIGTLRRLGLSDMLLRNESGYLLDPARPIRRSETLTF